MVWDSNKMEICVGFLLLHFTVTVIKNCSYTCDVYGLKGRSFNIKNSKITSKSLYIL